MRREATTRNPASSNLAMILPVRLRRVASGLMMERVRSVAMKTPVEKAPPYASGSRGRSMARFQVITRDEAASGVQGEPEIRHSATSRKSHAGGYANPVHRTGARE